MCKTVFYEPVSRAYVLLILYIQFIVYPFANNQTCGKHVWRKRGSLHFTDAMFHVQKLVLASKTKQACLSLPYLSACETLFLGMLPEVPQWKKKQVIADKLPWKTLCICTIACPQCAAEGCNSRVLAHVGQEDWPHPYMN